MGQRLNVVVLAEGAIDSEGQPITSDAVRDVKFIFSYYFIIYVDI
jgi:hypothetical protein